MQKIVNENIIFFNHELTQFNLINSFNETLNKGSLTIIDANKNIVGSLIYAVNGKSMYFDSLNVKLKQNGLGTCLITYLEKLALKHNCTNLDAYMNNSSTSDETLKSILTRNKFYKSLGFEISKISKLDKMFTLYKSSDQFFKSNAQTTFIQNQFKNANIKH